MEAQYVNSVMALERAIITEPSDNFLVMAAKEAECVALAAEKDIQDSNSMNQI